MRSINRSHRPETDFLTRATSFLCLNTSLGTYLQGTGHSFAVSKLEWKQREVWCCIKFMKAFINRYLTDYRMLGSFTLFLIYILTSIFYKDHYIGLTNIIWVMYHKRQMRKPHILTVNNFTLWLAAAWSIHI